MDKSIKKRYYHLLMMVMLSFVAMYGLMYAIVDVFASACSNFDQVYMAGLMTDCEYR